AAEYSETHPHASWEDNHPPHPPDRIPQPPARESRRQAQPFRARRPYCASRRGSTRKKFQSPFVLAPSPLARRRPPAGGSSPSGYEKSEQNESQNKPRRRGIGPPLLRKRLFRAPLRSASPRWCVQILPGTLAGCPGSPPGGTNGPALPDSQ